METRQLGLGDFDQVSELIEERFSTFVEYDKVRHKTFVTIDEDGFDEFKTKSIANLKANVWQLHLNAARPFYRIYGSLAAGKLMSFMTMHVVSGHEWMFDNIKAREVPLTQTGLRETLQLAFRTVEDANLSTYYCQMAKYREPKFKTFLDKLIPEFHLGYDGSIIRTIPAYSFTGQDVEEGMMGYRLPLVDLVVKKMILREKL